MAHPIAPPSTPVPAISTPISPVLGACINEITSRTTVGACAHESARVSVLGVNIHNLSKQNTAGYSDWY